MCLQSDDCTDLKNNIKLEDHVEENNKELRRLQFYGAGPKMAGYTKVDEEKSEKNNSNEFDPVS